MALYVRYLTIFGHEVEVTVTRVVDEYEASLRVFPGRRRHPSLKTFRTTASSADEADRAAQQMARDFLQAKLGQAQGST